MDADELDWNRALREQWEFHWNHELRARLVPAAFTTIAWRLGHVIVGVLAARNAAHFGAPAASYETWEYVGSAATALDQLEASSTSGWPGCAASARPGSGFRSARRSPSPRRPWPIWCCTSTAS
jgi:hypothetical protein